MKPKIFNVDICKVSVTYSVKITFKLFIMIHVSSYFKVKEIKIRL